MTEAERKWNKKLAAELRRLAVAKGVTLVDLSRLSHVPYSSLCAYVSTGQRMSVWTLSRLCKALEIAPAVLLGGAL